MNRKNISHTEEKKRIDAEEMLRLYLRLPDIARTRIHYMTEGAALVAGQVNRADETA